MGQVPQLPQSLTYGLVGNGRLGLHLARYFELEGIRFTSWSRSGASTSVEEALAQCDVILLAIRDSAIGPFLEEHPSLRDKTCVHFSGAISVTGVLAYHPLMTFAGGDSLYDLETYRSIAFVGDPGFPRIFPLLKNPCYEIAPGLRPLYHSLCVMSGNFTVLLWQKLFGDLSGKLKIPAEAAFPYLRQVAANIERHPGGALTGPIARGDQETVEQNLLALEREGDPFEQIYRSFVRAVAPQLGDTPR